MSEEKETNGVPTPFRGLRVLLVDNDTTSLLNIASELEDYSYRVTTTELATVALSILQERTDRFDLVMADINMPEMDCFKFIKSVQLIKDFPIILMSTELKKDMVKEAMIKGACFFLKKPISSKNLKNVWQHAYRNSKHEIMIRTKKAAAPESINIADQEAESQGAKVEKENKVLEIVDERTLHESENEQVGDSDQIENDHDDSVDGKAFTKICTKRCVSTENDERRESKRKRTENEEASPENISEMSKEPNLTQRQISSYLQKYRVESSTTELNRATSLPTDRSKVLVASSTSKTSYEREFLSAIPIAHPGVGSLATHVNRHRHYLSGQLSDIIHYKQVDTSVQLDEFEAFTDSTRFPTTFMQLLQQKPNFCEDSPVQSKFPNKMANVNQKQLHGEN
ncbi:hypothetical protein DH2020_032041 [Rehmannia glutinosa]|uniref:Response regulatory domain-containing protein n=1 Tax=Rehmannia glutinosa TaxID=99300 RepID=A0ABR0VIT0_REHGL